MQSKIITCESDGIRKTHFAYSRVMDKTKHKPWQTMAAWIATYNHQTKQIENNTFLGPIFDNHGTPCLAMDSKGYLHIVYGPHHHPFHYRKSLYPNNSSKWSDAEIISFQRGDVTNDSSYWKQPKAIDGKEWTYPIIKIDGKDNIHIAASLSKATIYTRKTGDHWEKAKTIYTANKQYSRYAVMMNISTDNEIVILAPDLDLHHDNEGYYSCDMDYHLFISNDHGNSFVDKGMVLKGALQGTGNCAIDSNNNIHWLAYERDFSTHRFLFHNRYDGIRVWQDSLQIKDRYIWDASMTITNDGEVLIFCAANQSTHHWRDASNQLYLFKGYKTGNFHDFSLQLIKESTADKNIWLPNIQDLQQQNSINRNDFFVMWSEEPDLKGDYSSTKEFVVISNLYAKLLDR